MHPYLSIYPIQDIQVAERYGTDKRLCKPLTDDYLGNIYIYSEHGHPLNNEQDLLVNLKVL